MPALSDRRKFEQTRSRTRLEVRLAHQNHNRYCHNPQSMLLKGLAVEFVALALMSRGASVNAQSETSYSAAVSFLLTACSLQDVGFQFGCDNQGTVRMNEVEVSNIHTTSGVIPTCNQVDRSHYQCTVPPLIPVTTVDTWLFFLRFDCIGSSSTQDLSGFVQSNVPSDAQCSGDFSKNSAEHTAHLALYDWERSIFLNSFSCTSGTFDPNRGCTAEASCSTVFGVCSDQFSPSVRAWQNPSNIPQGAIRSSRTGSGSFGSSITPRSGGGNLIVLFLVLLVIGVAIGLVSWLLCCRKTRPSEVTTEVENPPSNHASAIVIHDAIPVAIDAA